VFLIHGIWDSSSLWNNFSPLYSFGVSDPRFYVGLADYSNPVGSSIQASLPKFSKSILMSAKENALGFDYNADKVLRQIQSQISWFKNGGNPVGIPVAAVQVDVVAHSMGGDITRYLALQPSFLSGVTFGQGNVHKVITIDTPHLGTPLAIQILQNDNTCVRNLLASKGNIAFSSVILNGSSVNGAAGDFQGDGFGGSLSMALDDLKNKVTHPLPTALIAGIMDSGNLAHLLVPGNATAIYVVCGTGLLNPLALELTPFTWSAVFGGQDSDAIVPLASQLNGLSTVNTTVFSGYIHSNGTAQLGFGLPSITNDPTQTVQKQVIALLNTLVTSRLFHPLNP